jgi:formamidopyrimidine-DNA glycosylase
VPELPDVEAFSRYLERTAAHRRIEDVQVHAPRMLQEVSAPSFAQRVKKKQLEHPKRHGKLLFVDLGEDGSHLVMHFGMTGFLHFAREPRDISPHARVRFRLDDGSHLDYDDQRMFGHVGIVEDVDAYLRDAGVGPDVLQLDREAFVERLQQRRGGVKRVLMDQSLMAGIGNVYSDEILFHARLHPLTPVEGLSRRTLQRLHQATRHVLERAIEADADPARMPRTWLLPHRRPGQHCPRCGSALERIKVQQRSAWLCPHCQPRG